MAINAFRDPRRARLQNQAAAAAQKTTEDPAVAGGPVQGAKPVRPFVARPVTKKPVQPVKPPLDTSQLDTGNNAPVPVRPVTDPRTQLASIADTMKTQRESGDLGSLLKTTTEQYLPQVQKLQTSLGTVDTGQVERILGTANQIPQSLPEQQKMLGDLAAKLQSARETGDMGTVNALGQQYQALVQAMKGQVTGAPTASSGAPGEVTSPLQKSPAQGSTAAGAPAAAPPPGGTPSTVPEAPVVNDGSGGLPPKPVVNPPQGVGDQGGVPTAFDANSLYGDQLKNPQLMFRTANGSMVPDPSGAQKIQGVIDYDNQFANNPPANVAGQPGGQKWWNDQVQKEAAFFAKELQQYPDQFDKIYANHQKRLGEISARWDSVGKWESQLQEKLNGIPPEAKVQIENLPEAQKNEFYRQAIADMQAGKDPSQNIGKYLSQFSDINTDFKLGEPGYQSKDINLDPYQKADGIEITGPDNVDLSTDKSKIDAALNRTTMSDEGKKALALQLETIQKRLAEGGGGFSDADLQKMAAPMFEQIDRDLASQLSATQQDMAAAGYDGAAINAKSTEIRQAAALQKRQAAMELVRENMGYKQQGTSEAIAALGGVAESERQAGLAEKGLALEGATTQTELTSKEKEAQAAANLSQKALSQEGKLYAWGKKVDENLSAYGMKLDQYKTDKGFDIDRLKIDLDERVAQGELTAEGAKLALQKVQTSIEAAQKETELYDRRASLIAELEQRASQNDQDAQYRVQALKVSQELTVLGIKSDETKAFANIMYGVMGLGKQLDQQDKEFMMKLAATKEAQESGGFMDFLGNVFGSFAGGFAGKAGADLYGAL